MARQINTEELRSSYRAGRYLRLPELASITAISAPPEGFELALTTDGATYAFSLKDTLDPCRFSFFSDQAGLIYEGRPLR